MGESTGKGFSMKDSRDGKPPRIGRLANDPHCSCGWDKASCPTHGKSSEHRKEERRNIGGWGQHNPERRSSGPLGRRRKDLLALGTQVIVDRAALRSLLEWCRDAIDFDDPADQQAGEAYAELVKPLLAELTPEENRAWEKGFEFYASIFGRTENIEGLSDDAVAYRVWQELCEEFPRLNDYMGALP